MTMGLTRIVNSGPYWTCSICRDSVGICPHFFWFWSGVFVGSVRDV